MLKMLLPEEILEYRTRCLQNIKEAPTVENAEYWLKRANECDELYNKFRQMEMRWDDWARMKQIAELNREERTLTVCKI